MGFGLVVLGCYCGPSWRIADFRGFVERVLVGGVVGCFGGFRFEYVVCWWVLIDCVWLMVWSLWLAEFALGGV